MELSLTMIFFLPSVLFLISDTAYWESSRFVKKTRARHFDRSMKRYVISPYLLNTRKRNFSCSISATLSIQTQFVGMLLPNPSCKRKTHYKSTRWSSTTFTEHRLINENLPKQGSVSVTLCCISLQYPKIKGLIAIMITQNSSHLTFIPHHLHFFMILNNTKSKWAF